MYIEYKINTVELILDKAKSHVQMYQIQRNYSRKVKSIARLDITYHLHYLFRSKVLTMYMGQNLCRPSFEGRQPGDTYYMSSLTALIFGVVKTQQKISNAWWMPTSGNIFKVTVVKIT